MSGVLYTSNTGGGTHNYDAARLQRLVDLLPPETIAKLAQGPIDDDGPGHAEDGYCRACAALDGLELSLRSPVSRAYAVLMDFHQGWDLRERGEIVNCGDGVACYLRTLLVYLLAGWDGIHD